MCAERHIKFEDEQIKTCQDRQRDFNKAKKHFIKFNYHVLSRLWLGYATHNILI